MRVRAILASSSGQEGTKPHDRPFSLESSGWLGYDGWLISDEFEVPVARENEFGKSDIVRQVIF